VAGRNFLVAAAEVDCGDGALSKRTYTPTDSTRMDSSATGEEKKCSPDMFDLTGDGSDNDDDL